MRLQARRTALCGLLCALSVVLLTLGGLIPAALYACPLLAMMALLPVREEFGRGAALTVYAAVSILAVLLVADKELALVYVFFGWYPPVQPVLDRLHPRPVKIAVKLVLGNLSLAALYGLLLFVFRLESVVAELEGLSAALTAAMLLAANCVFVLTDIALHRFSRLWHKKRHH